MSKKWFKKSIAVLMAATMLVSMAGCNKKEGTKSKKEAVKDTKEMVYEATDFAVDGVEGDISELYVQNGKLYLTTYEYTEPDLSFLKDKVDSDEEDAGEESDASEEAAETESNVSEVTAEEESDESEEAAETESNVSEVTAETEGDASEETDEEGQDSEESEDEESEDWLDDIDFESLSDEELEAFYKAQEEATTTRLYAVNIDGTDLKELTYPEMEEGQSVGSFAVAKDGTIAFLVYNYDMKTEKSTYLIVKQDDQGNEIAREDITKLLKMSDESYIGKFILDDKGRIILSAESSLYILDENMTKADEIKQENDSYMEGMAITKDGQVVCGVTSWGEEDSSTYLQVLDVDNKKWGERYELELSYFSGAECLMNGVDYDVYYSDDSGIYGYNIAEKKAEKLLDFVASNITSEHTFGIKPLGKDQFIGTSYDEDYNTSIVVYNKVDPSTIVDKTVITFGDMWVNDDIKKQAIEFNKKSKEYKIEFIDYSNEEDPIAKMNADIAAGNVPDIINISSLPYEQYAAKGMFEDLAPYYEKDKDISPSDLIPSVYEAMKSKDDKLYYISPSFGISTLLGKTSDVGEEIGWTFDEMKALLEEKGEGVRPFYSQDKVGMLYSFLYSGINDFVNWETGECRFDGQDFKDILELCNTGTNEETDYENAPSMSSEIQEGKVLFVEGWMDFDQLQMYQKMYNDDITFIGYPDENKSGSYFQFNNQLAMYSKSEVKEGAWEFLRTFMAKEYQGKNYMNYDNPTRQDCMDMLIKAKMATEEYTDEFGQEIYPSNGSMGWEDFEVELGPLSQEEMDAYMELVNNTHKVVSYDESMIKIIEEETKPYFAGEKNLEETVKVIQNRITTYVNENR